MNPFLGLSVLVHAVVVLALWLGLPQLQKPLPEPVHIVPVEIAELAPMTAAPEEKKPEEKKPEPPKPEPPKPEPPKPEPPKPQPVKEPEKADPLLEEKPKKKPKPPETKPQPEKASALSSVLKNVAKLKDEKPVPKTPDKPTEKPSEKPAEQPAEKKSDAPAPSALNRAERLTSSEEDAIRQQLRGCWNVPVGGKDIDNMAVEIYIAVNPDRTVKEVLVVDQNRYNRDSFFRALADSAVRALKNPRCSPLALPPEKYQQWKETIFNFNPRDMF